MVSWPFLLLSWPVRNHIILALALVLRGQLTNAWGCHHRPIIVDSSDFNAGVSFSGVSWVTKNDDPSAGVFFFGGSTMMTSSNGDSVEFAFTGDTVVAFGDVGKKHAKFSVEMDGRAVGEGTAFSASGFQTFVPLWREAGLQNGEHRLRITHNDISGLWLSVDKFLYRNNETGAFESPPCDSPSTSTLTQTQTSSEPDDTLSTLSSCSSAPEYTPPIPSTTPSDTSPLSWDDGESSSITPSATAPPENAVPWISYSSSSPTASAAEVVNLDSMTVGSIIGITIGGTALGMAILVCCFFGWRHRRAIFKDRRKSLATQTIKSEHAPTITPYHWPPGSDSSAELRPSNPVPEMMRFANAPPDSVVEVETASEQEVDLEASLPPMSPVRSSTGTVTHSILIGEVPIGMAPGRRGFSSLGDSLPTTPNRVAFSAHPHVPRSPSSPNSWGFAPSSPTAVHGGRHSPVASSHSEKTGKGDKIDRTSAWGYWDRLTIFPTRSDSPVSHKTNETERSRKYSNSLFSR